MAAGTFGEAWRAVRLHCPLLPAMLSQFMVKEAYQEICDARRWSWLRAENAFQINIQKTGTVDVTNGSATINGGTFSYATTDADRQFRIDGGPVYTIITATVAAFTLDRPYGETTATGASAAVLDAYISMPSDFQSFLAVLDIENDWQLRLWITEDELNTWDTRRSSTGTPCCIVSRRLGTAGTYIRRIQYELWPYQLVAKSFPYFYIRRPETLEDSTLFLGPLADDISIVVKLALAKCSEWPGVDGKKNPYFNLALAQSLRKQAGDRLDRLQVLDEEIYMTWMETSPSQKSYAPFPFGNARFMQSHAVGAGSGWGAF